MLLNVTNDVKQHYYDQTLHGIDWDGKVREAKAKIETADSINHALSHVAAVLDSLDDTHTFFLPPPRPYIDDYGFEMEMIGDRCYVMHVRPGSDAEAKGMKAGDEVVTLNGYTPTRKSYFRMTYLFWVLRPQPGFRLVLRSPAGEQRQVDVSAKFKQLPETRDVGGERMFDPIREAEDWERTLRPLYADRGNGLLIVKFPQFIEGVSDVESVLQKMQGHDAVILDLRGNPGGKVETLQFLLGGLFESKVKIVDRQSRGKSKLIETELRSKHYTGKLVILLDSGSASASEVFARVVQLEKRGIVVGDQSSGAVMESMHYSHTTQGTAGGTVIPFGASVTEADLVMSDGQSLEHKGVVPDTIVLPSGADLAAGRDPQIAKAAELVNVKISAEEAGKLFPYEWPKE